MIGNFRSSRPAHWVSPKSYSDPSLRLQTYGRVQPMEEPRVPLLRRLFGGVR